MVAPDTLSDTQSQPMDFPETKIGVCVCVGGGGGEGKLRLRKIEWVGVGGRS